MEEELDEEKAKHFIRLLKEVVAIIKIEQDDPHSIVQGINNVVEDILGGRYDELD